jgi:hypothetical protein
MSLYGNGNQSYEERQSVLNFGEQFFEDWCWYHGHQFVQIGFKEKSNPAPDFGKVNVVLRNMPDYLVRINGSLQVVNVKGTANIKQVEITALPALLEAYSSHHAPLVYAFCFKGQKDPIFLYPERVMALYEQSTDKRWSDGKVYRTLDLNYLICEYYEPSF